MQRISRHIALASVLFCYLLGSVLIEFTHHDETIILLQSKPVLETHDCGAKEIHLAWDDARHCVACSYFTQRVTTISTPVIGVDASVVLFTVSFLHAEKILQADILHSGKRGPPAA